MKAFPSSLSSSSSSSSWTMLSLLLLLWLFDVLCFAVSPLIVHSPDNVQAPVGSRVQFDCQVTGNPRPTVKWQRDSIPIPLTTSHKHQVTPDGSLVIQDVNRNDVGVYECIAENFAGTAHAEAFLEVVGELMQLTREVHSKCHWGTWPIVVLVSTGDTFQRFLCFLRDASALCWVHFCLHYVLFHSVHYLPMALVTIIYRLMMPNCSFNLIVPFLIVLPNYLLLFCLCSILDSWY